VQKLAQSNGEHECVVAILQDRFNGNENDSELELHSETGNKRKNIYDKGLTSELFDR